MVPTIRYKRGDTAPLGYTIQGYNTLSQGATTYDLTNKTVTFSMIADQAASWTVYDSPASIVDADAGVVQYNFNSNETATSGMYRVLWKVTDTNGKVATFPDAATQWLFIMDDQVM